MFESATVNEPSVFEFLKFTVFILFETYGKQRCSAILGTYNI